MVHGLTGRHELAILVEWTARIVIPVKKGKIAARDIDANPMALFKQIPGLSQWNRVFVDLSRRDRLRVLKRVPITRSDDAVADGHREPIRIHVHEFGREIGLRCG